MVAKESYDIDASDIIVTKRKGRRKKEFGDGDTLSCSCCSYPYTTWDMFIAFNEIKVDPATGGIPMAREGTDET
jgi:hypothetical protein